MKYATLFQNTSSADGFKINNIPWVGWENQRERVLHCKQAGKQLKVIDGELKVVDSCPEGFVDFGLPSCTLWSTKNLGATNGNTKESWFGNYYKWGDIDPLEIDFENNTCDPTCDWNNYKYLVNNHYLIKYCTNPATGYEGFTDGLTQLLPEDDAANIFNSEYSIPTKIQYEELISNTIASWQNNYQGISGLNGLLLTKGSFEKGIKNISLYTIIDPTTGEPGSPYEIDNNTWNMLSDYTLNELITIFGIDPRLYIFKDISCQEIAEYDIDYRFAVKQEEPNISMFIPAAGYCRSNAIADYEYQISYFTSNLDEQYQMQAHAIFFNGFDLLSDHYHITLDYNSRINATPIRPVITTVS